MKSVVATDSSYNFFVGWTVAFPIPGRSIIIAFNGDVQPRIKAPFPFQNILSRPWSVKISLTDGTSCWIHLVKPWICGLSSILHCRKNGPSEKWAVGVMGCRSNGLSELWAVGIVLRIHRNSQHFPQLL